MSIALTIIFLVLFFVIFLLYFYRLIRSDKTIKHLRAQIERLLVEVNEISDQNITLLDDRINTIKHLLVEVDSSVKDAKKTIELLAREKQKQLEHNNRYIALQKSAIESASIEKKSIRAVSPSAPDPQGEPNASKQDKRQKILQLFRSGLSAENVATHLGIALGEVELVLSLNGYTNR